MRRRTFDPVYYTCIKVSVSLQVADKAKLEAGNLTVYDRPLIATACLV
jgi:hypothetical protein